MTFNEYQAFTGTTAVYPRPLTDLVYPALKLSEEAGEVDGKLGKVIRGDYPGTDIHNLHRNPELVKALALELGDVLWYVARLATALGLTLNDVAKMNKKKLLSRKHNGTIKGSGDNR
jgi:NTP pyrophosphatase (non-canonical NTP hydrolase)